jgi:hypothetical protein
VADDVGDHEKGYGDVENRVEDPEERAPEDSIS